MAGEDDNLYHGAKSRWRKYGEKQPAGKEGVIKTYFRCTHPGCPAKRTVTRHPGQAMHAGAVEMVTGHSHTEQEYQSAVTAGTPRQHRRNLGSNKQRNMSVQIIQIPGSAPCVKSELDATPIIPSFPVIHSFKPTLEAVQLPKAL